jgi:anti-sigma factor RsiW
VNEDSEPDMDIQCNDAAPLVSAYLDGELSEAQASPLRKHLLGCVTCRGSAQDLKNLRRWFVAPAAPAGNGEVPSGFAARVARRAFAGDTGVPAPPAAAEPSARELLPFVRELTALAAAVLLMLAIGLELGERPAGQPLKADEVPTLEEIEDELERLNAEAGRAPQPSGVPEAAREHD